MIIFQCDSCGANKKTINQKEKEIVIPPSWMLIGVKLLCVKCVTSIIKDICRREESRDNPGTFEMKVKDLHNG